MDRLDQLRVFLRVAERASFSAVARELGLQQPAVSKAIGALEESLGVRLVNRNTRSVALTEAGRDYYERARAAVVALDEADAAVRHGPGALSGVLRVAAPVPFGLAHIVPLVVSFSQAHPRLSVHLMLDDLRVDLVAEGIDVAIRVGVVGADTLVARRLGESPILTVASPAYLAGRDVPRDPSDLERHECLIYSNQNAFAVWAFRGRGGGAMPVRVSGRLWMSSLLGLKTAALAGAGIARLPRWMVEDEIAQGTLTAVLAEFAQEPMPIHAVFPMRQVATKARVFADHVKDAFERHPLFGMRQDEPRVVAAVTPDRKARTA
jgi:DNA-binding transcriptional LysR family regulator